jgi:hypothetical protein
VKYVKLDVIIGQYKGQKMMSTNEGYTEVFQNLVLSDLRGIATALQLP